VRADSFKPYLDETLNVVEGIQANLLRWFRTHNLLIQAIMHNPRSYSMAARQERSPPNDQVHCHPIHVTSNVHGNVAFNPIFKY
jgi:hypothetical protein